jgi:hypothetical protein
MTQTVLVLGASGHFGSQAARAFAAAGWTVKPFQRGTDMTAAAKGVDLIVNALNPPNYHAWDRLIPQITAEVIASPPARPSSSPATSMSTATNPAPGAPTPPIAPSLAKALSAQGWRRSTAPPPPKACA